MTTPKRILYIEDDAMTRDIVSIRLTRAGYGLTCIETGDSALEYGGTGDFDLILLDLGLPGISGIEVAKCFKADSRTKSIPILALSAHVLTSERKRALAAGCNDFDSKPINFSRLIQHASTRNGIAKIKYQLLR